MPQANVREESGPFDISDRLVVRRRRTSLVLACLFALSAAGWLPTTSQAAGAGLSMSADGRATSVVAHVTVRNPGRSSRTRLVLQARPAGPRARWKVKLIAPARVKHGVSRHTLTWRRPPLKRAVDVRVLAKLSKHRVLRSGQSTVTAGDPGTIFYSGRNRAGAGNVGRFNLRLVASDILGLFGRYDGTWTSKEHCGIENAVPAQSSIGAEPIAALAGYSLGRLGPIFFLRNHPAWESQIHYILLLDPGAQSEMDASSNPPGCESDPDIDPAGTLAAWLKADPSNRLLVIAGPRTQGDQYKGLDRFYLSKVTPEVSQQVTVCAHLAAKPDHLHFLDDSQGGYGWMVGAEPPSGCPGGTLPRPLKASSLPQPTFTPLPTITPVPTVAPTQGSGGTSSGGGSAGTGGTGGSTGAGPVTPAPAPQTWGETTGGVTHTWTNWTNAGGYEGPTIPSNATVQIACKLPGFRVADGNTWWYRIAQAPWSGAYYVSADAFYNNGQTSGSLHGTPYVDGAVRDC